FDTYRLDVAVEERGELRLRQRADFRRFDFAVLEQHQRRDAANAITRRRLLIRVDVHLADFDAIAVFACDLFQDRRDHLAWPTPFGPVVDEDRLVRLEYVFVEAGITDVDDLCAHRTNSHVVRSNSRELRVSLASAFRAE